MHRRRRGTCGRGGPIASRSALFLLGVLLVAPALAAGAPAASTSGDAALQALAQRAASAAASAIEASLENGLDAGPSLAGLRTDAAWMRLASAHEARSATSLRVSVPLDAELGPLADRTEAMARSWDAWLEAKAKGLDKAEAREAATEALAQAELGLGGARTNADGLRALGIDTRPLDEALDGYADALALARAFLAGASPDSLNAILRVELDPARPMYTQPARVRVLARAFGAPADVTLAVDGIEVGNVSGMAGGLRDVPVNLTPFLPGAHVLTAQARTPNVTVQAPDLRFSIGRLGIRLALAFDAEEVPPGEPVAVHVRLSTDLGGPWREPVTLTRDERAWQVLDVSENGTARFEIARPQPGGRVKLVATTQGSVPIEPARVIVMIEGPPVPPAAARSLTPLAALLSAFLTAAHAALVWVMAPRSGRARWIPFVASLVAALPLLAVGAQTAAATVAGLNLVMGGSVLFLRLPRRAPGAMPRPPDPPASDPEVVPASTPDHEDDVIARYHSLLARLRHEQIDVSALTPREIETKMVERGMPTADVQVIRDVIEGVLYRPIPPREMERERFEGALVALGGAP